MAIDKDKNPVPAKKPRSPQGGYVYKPIVSIITLCSCGGKYVKTRVDQIVCVRCIQKEANRKR